MMEKEMAGTEILEPVATEPQSGLWDITNDAYHADRQCQSNSTLKVFRESRKKYRAVYIDGTMQPGPPSESMVLGSAIDCWLLERERFDFLYCIGPEGDKRTKAVKLAWQEFDAAGRTILTSDQLAAVKAMAEAVLADAGARALIEQEGTNQQAIRWQCPETGIWLKARFDRILKCGVAVSLKTSVCPAPSQFARQAYNLGYHRQTALYIAGRKAVWSVPCDAPEYVLVVGNEPPWEVAVCEFDQDALGLGRRQNRQTLADLEWARTENCWDSPWANQVNSLSLPRWAFTEE